MYLVADLSEGFDIDSWDGVSEPEGGKVEVWRLGENTEKICGFNKHAIVYGVVGDRIIYSDWDGKSGIRCCAKDGADGEH